MLTQSAQLGFGVYQVCKHCMLTQSAQPGCSCVWALASTQTRRLVQSMPTQKPYKRYDEGEGLHPFEPCCKGDTPLVHPRVYVLAQRAHRKSVDFFPKVCSTYLVIFTHLDLFLRELCFFK